MALLILGVICVCLIGLSSGNLLLPKGRYDDTLFGLCKNNNAFAKVPWDCQAYVQCKNTPGNKEIFLFRCPAALEFDLKHKTCVWASSKCPPLKDVVDQFCASHPTARLPNPDNCAQYYDCALKDAQFPGKSIYLRECAYPQLFDLVSFECMDYKFVQCDARNQPVSPCDYVAYQCTGPNCKSCTEGIKGCDGKPDGQNPYPERLLSKYFVVCENNKATSVSSCPSGLFDPIQKICTQDLDPAAVSEFCALNPTGKLANPRNCAMFFDCTKRNKRENLDKFSDECPYPMYYDSLRTICKDFREVKCGNRSQPLSKCQYQRYRCRGPDCPVCEAIYPSCVGLTDGLHSYPGRENTAYYIECLEGRTIDMSSTCPNRGIFDPRSRTCTGGSFIRPVDPIRPPVNPIGPILPRGDCVSNPSALLPDSLNCARYLNCSKVDPFRGGLASIRDECSYPQLFDTRIRACANFIEVNCGNRYEPKSPCEYENTKNLCYGPMCDMRCEERSPSCVGKPDGNNTFPERELTSFYITCLINRTLSVGICRYGVYDPTQRVCTTQIDPLSIRNFCLRHPSFIFPHVVDCARYYNCSDSFNNPVFGPYLRECSYPELFNIAERKCVPPEQANCRWRLKPKNPCDYMANQYCDDPSNCPPCEERFPSCTHAVDGRNPIRGTDDRYFVCNGGQFVSLGRCVGALGAFDPIQRICKAPYDCSRLSNGNHPVPGSDTNYFTCLNRNYVEKKSCAPDTFDLKERVCIQSPCAALPDGNYVIPGQKVDYFVCQNGKFMSQVSCHPFNFDQSSGDCFTHPDCTGLNGNYPLPNSQLEYFKCQNDRYIETASCAPQTYNPQLQRCNLPSCLGLPDGNNELKGSDAEFILCRNSYYIRTGSCSPSVFDTRSRQCKTLECTNLPDGTYPVPGTDVAYLGSDTEWIRCENGKRAFGDTCNSLPYDPIAGKCRSPPSCAGNTNGNHIFPGMDFAYYACENDILLFIRSCAPFTFDETTRECKLPSCPDDGNYALSWNNRAYVTCRNGQIVFEGDCGQTLFNPLTRQCHPRPVCAGLMDGRHLLIGSEYLYYECVNNAFVVMESCSPDVFNAMSGRCIPPVNPSDPALFCKRNPTAILPHPDSCARFIDCSNENTLLKSFQEECPYPLLVDSTDGVCKPYREVKCGKRPEPKSPCDYEKVRKCQLPGGACPPCEQEHPSCFGKPDGSHAIPNRPEWFVHCSDERTYDVQQCPSTAPFFDPSMGTCSVLLDPLNPSPYCKANPTVVVPHPDNCAQFVDCRQMHTNFGKYRQECPYPGLFHERRKTCLPFPEVNCTTRPAPKAPCEYELVLQQCTGIDCEPCEQRNPSCVGLPNGNNTFPGRRDKYIICSNDRTVGRESCGFGFFDPVDRICTVKFDPADPKPYCDVNPRENVVNEMICSQYHNCSKPNSDFGPYLDECPYPLLFSRRTKDCEEFTVVDCDTRFEPMTPCEYLQNKCIPKPGASSCEPCIERLPSCIGLPDGNNTYPGRENTPSFITCFRNRTIYVRSCDLGFFNPLTRKCQFTIDIANPRPFCLFSKVGRVAHPNFCAKYFDCSIPNSPYGPYIQECSYPKLFSEVTNNCEDFSSVNCNGRLEPQDPCDYDQNSCFISPDPSCTPCKDRIPSCVGHSSGNHTFPGREMSPHYIVCYQNRTEAVRLCDSGFYDPESRMCQPSVTAAAIRTFCEANPGVIKANPSNCAQYFDCGAQSAVAKTYLRECPYPMQFSADISACRDFLDVQCGTRLDVKLPCQYLQNRCTPRNKTCIPCRQRFPSCEGLKNGNHSLENRPMQSGYKTCFHERTIYTGSCGDMLFDPESGVCIRDVTDAMIKEYCRLNSSSILPHPYHCAQYFDCRELIGNSYLRECRYPHLFQLSSKLCRYFEYVDCGKRFEPQEPCDYLQNHCPENYTNCIPCKDRLPSCLSLSDGNHPFPGRPDSEYYINCIKNRTRLAEPCPLSLYDVNERKCSKVVDDGLLERRCRQQRTALIADPLNCAFYYNCSDFSIKEGLNKTYLSECVYPKLFAGPSSGCQIFTRVNCSERYEPRAPCEYVQNQCHGDNCGPCEDKYPSCIDKDDGSNVFPGKELTRLYTLCYSNRTVAIVSCAVGVYSHVEQACIPESDLTLPRPLPFQ